MTVYQCFLTVDPGFEPLPSMSEPVVLSYHNSLLRQSDVELLAAPNWLNDTLIGFYLEYLEHEVFPEWRDQLLFLGPDVCQLARLCEAAELSQLLDQLKLSERQLVVAPVSDCEELQSPGGSHWSLLVFERCRRQPKRRGTFWHFDSQPSGGGNRAAASALCRRLTPLLMPEGAGCTSQMQQGCGGRQMNGYDCGVFVLCHAHAVTERFCKGESVRRANVCQQDANCKRSELLEIVHRLSI